MKKQREKDRSDSDRIAGAIDGAAARQLRFFDADSRRIFFPLFYYMLFTQIFIYLAKLLLPGSLNPNDNTFHYPPGDRLSVLSIYKTFDAEHYLYLSNFGYQAGSSSNAFYPLWPFLIKIGAFLTGGNHIFAGLILANIFSIAGMMIFHFFTRNQHGEKVADLALLFLIAFPGSIFFSLIYSEPLFFFLTMLFFLCLLRRQHGAAAIVAFFLPLTRAVGIFICIPLLLHIYFTSKWSKALLLSLLPLLGYLTYFFIIYCYTGNTFAGFAAQRDYAAHSSIEKLFHPLDFIRAIFIPLKVHGVMNSAIDRIWFVYFIGALYPIWKQNRYYCAYSLPMGLAPAITQSFMSFTRYTLMIFPLFIVTAQFFAPEDRKAWRWAALAILFSLKTLFLIMQINSYWVG